MVALVTRRSPVQILAQSAVAVPLTGTTNETTLATITLPAGAMGANGQIVFEALFSCTNSANDKTPRFKFGGQTIYAVPFTTTASILVRRIIANRNAANSQVSSTASTAASYNATTSGNFGSIATYAVDTSAEVTILITGQLESGAETMTLESYSVVMFPKA